MINKYPYTDFHEINLDWILAQIKALHQSYDDFKALNTITNAGAWDITKQYQAWTVVSDNNAGYISLKPVPAGIAISNTEYWGLIADYNILITNLSSRISALEADNITNKASILALQRKTTRKCAFFGNSFASGVNGVQGIYYQIKDLYDSDVVYIRSGAGFLPYTNHSGDSFIDAINLASYDADVTDVVIIGAVGDCRSQQEYSTNDWVDAMRNAISSFMAYVSTKYPNCDNVTYVDCSACPHLHDVTSYSASGYSDFQAEFWLHNLMPRCIEGTDMKYGGWAGWVIMLNDLYFQSDNVHPTQTGTYLISERCRSVLQGVGLEYPSKVITDNGATMHLGPNTDCTVNITNIITPYQTTQYIQGATNPAAGESVSGANVQMFDFDTLSFYPPVGRYQSTGGVFGGTYNVPTYAQFSNANSKCRENFNATTATRNINQFRSFYGSQAVDTTKADRFPAAIILGHNPLNGSAAP